MLYQIENEYATYVTSATGIDYMPHLYDKVRADGITVPIFHNDKGRNGFWVPGAFTGADGLAGPIPVRVRRLPGGTCSPTAAPAPGTPPTGATSAPAAPRAAPPRQPEHARLRSPSSAAAGSTRGAAQLFGGAGYACLRGAAERPAYERDFYLTNIANGITLQNFYMTFGGTSWGWLPAPVVYTSYDYGAAIDEAPPAAPPRSRR